MLLRFFDCVAFGLVDDLIVKKCCAIVWNGGQKGGRMKASEKEREKYVCE